MNVVEKITFQARSKRTIAALVDIIVSRVQNTMSDEFGEFVISVSAQNTLESEYQHEKLPLAELLKEKVIGNPGFDFHSESSTNFISFGEAKYSGSRNPYPKAINQIVDFIKLEKDSAEFTIIQHFVTEDAVNNYIKEEKAYVAAFSINAQNAKTIMKNALESTHIKALFNFPEVYIIGIEINV